MMMQMGLEMAENRPLCHRQKFSFLSASKTFDFIKLFSRSEANFSYLNFANWWRVESMFLRDT
jgi:hypothetical protein